MKYLLIALTLVVTGCAGAKVTSSNGRTVVVSSGFPDMGVEKALIVADAECAKRNLAARVMMLSSPTTDKYIFECVQVQ